MRHEKAHEQKRLQIGCGAKTQDLDLLSGPGLREALHKADRPVSKPSTFFSNFPALPATRPVVKRCGLHGSGLRGTAPTRAAAEAEKPRHERGKAFQQLPVSKAVYPVDLAGDARRGTRCIKMPNLHPRGSSTSHSCASSAWRPRQSGGDPCFLEKGVAVWQGDPAGLLHGVETHN